MKISRNKVKVCTPRNIFGVVTVLSVLITTYAYNVQETNRKQFESLSVTLAENVTIEYGDDEVNLDKYIKNSKGNVKIKENNVDTMNVGKSEVLLNVSEGEHDRTYSLKVEVKDTNEPIIEVENKDITLDYEEDYDVKSNILSVSDKVDGEFLEVPADTASENIRNNYAVISDLDTSKAGTYKVTVIAIDQHENKTEETFNVTVKEKAKPVIFRPAIVPVHIENDEITPDKQGIVNTAYSLLGYNYVFGGNTLAGFDCSGLVNYVYGQNGISVSKSSATQLYEGTSVSYSEMKPGDILVWGYGFSPTHVSIYVGGGNMIHAANKRKGVILSSVSAWATYGTNIVSIRRI